MTHRGLFQRLPFCDSVIPTYIASHNGNVTFSFIQCRELKFGNEYQADISLSAQFSKRGQETTCTCTNQVSLFPQEAA